MRRSGGHALAEYTILLALVGLVLVIGQDSPLEVLFRAVQQYYGRFTFSMSMP
jgi:Flp pilus assembly pilin Flp